MNAATSIGFDPVAEQLLTEGRDRKFASLGGRERTTRWAFAIAFLVVASAARRASPQPGGTCSALLLVLLVGGVRDRLADRVRGRERGRHPHGG